ncbi:unnamed protein product [Alopecurus aequalis]
MEVVRGSSNGGKLNPWAEPFVPGSWCRPMEVVAEVEDFSPEWWRLVASSPSFRDSWVRDYGDLGLLDADDGPDDDDDLFFSSPRTHLAEGEERKEEVAGRKGVGEVAPWGIEKWWRVHVTVPEVPKYAEKAPKKVVAGGPRFSPRTIQQPR